MFQLDNGVKPSSKILTDDGDFLFFVFCFFQIYHLFNQFYNLKIKIMPKVNDFIYLLASEYALTHMLKDSYIFLGKV